MSDFVKIRSALFFAVLLGTLLVLFLIFRNGPVFVDEWGHSAQIRKYLHGDWSPPDNMSTLPGYNLLMALPVKLTGSESIQTLRLVSLCGGWVGLFLFYRIVSRLWPRERYWRTAQFAFFPVCFPYWFLVYTDIWCLGFVLGAVLLALRHRVGWSAMAITVAVLIRQPAIFWATLLWLWFLAPSFKLGGSSLAAGVKRTWPFLLVHAGFLAFVVLNGGVALADRELHTPTLSLTNVWFFLFVIALLFLPQCLRGLAEIRSCGRAFFWRGLAVVLISWVLFGATFELANLYNKINLYYLLHNRLLYAVATENGARLLALAVIPVGLAGWLLTPLKSERFRWLLPVGLASVAVLPYVEPRYYIVPLTLLLAFRRPASRPVEAALTLFYIAFSVWIDVGVFRMWFFP